MSKIKAIVRSKKTFMEKIASKDPKTQAGYVQALQNFENFCLEKHGKAEVISDLKKLEETDIFEFLQSWINWNGSRAPRTITNYFSRVKIYLHYRGIKLHNEDIKQELDFKRRMTEDLHPLSVEEIQTILKALRYKDKVQFLCQLSGLMRIGETIQIRKKNLDTSGPNIVVKIPPNIAKFKKGRTTFFSKEASVLLRPLLKKIKDNDLVFGTNENPRFAELNIEQIMRRTLRKIGLDKRNDSNGRFQINTHSFRAFGITRISRHDPNFSKKLAGQKGYLDEYDRLTVEEMLELYQKFESDLIIDDTARLKTENEKLSKEKVEWQKELEIKQEEYTKRLKAEILAEINDTNHKQIHPLDAVKKHKEQSKRLKKEVGL